MRPTAETVQFRSVPFAAVTEPFQLARPLDTIPAQYDFRPHRDFTQWGYACPQLEQARDAGGGSLGEDDVRQYDEFACLNSTITAPKGALEGRMERLPVMVYLHGGAFVGGCGNIAASHDTGRMVAWSVEEGMSVIIVSLHYRCLPFGTNGENRRLTMYPVPDSIGSASSPAATFSQEHRVQETAS